MTRLTEVVPMDRAIWQSETAKAYLCPFCLRTIRSQYEGDELPVITCEGPMSPHRLEWTV
jgi:hypothetical protein